MTNTESKLQQRLSAFEFGHLLIEELGWDRHHASHEIRLSQFTGSLRAVAQKRGMVAWICDVGHGAIPDRAQRRLISKELAKASHEHLIIFVDGACSEQIWAWARREPGKARGLSEHFWRAGASNRAFVERLARIGFSISEESALTLVDVANRVRRAFDVERVTRRFYDRFRAEHKAFLDFVSGIDDVADREWYASLMLNRLMFIYFMQRKGFLNGEPDYLRNRLERCQRERGQDSFYSFYRYFLLRLFHEGLGDKTRNAELESLLGRIPYLNGGLFERHVIEERWESIAIPDEAFAQIFAYFDSYQWQLDERPLQADNEINPDVLGYIFEKYINQKQMGAYYTKEDITDYIGKNSIIPCLLEMVQVDWPVAFDIETGRSVWGLLQHDPDRYIHSVLRHGVNWDVRANHGAGEALPNAVPLPDEVSAGQTDISRRGAWNQEASGDCGLPGETWREVIARREFYQSLRERLLRGEVCSVSDLITLNLDIIQFKQDIVERCDDPGLLRAVWAAVREIAILDPTCGSGAFLFAALNILEPLYNSCLERMEAFVRDADRAGLSSIDLNDFRATLEQVSSHVNARYFILKSITLNNLYGVDIMEEAVEICKLRLFLKLAAQVEPDPTHPNLGIEPLPDIDFNVKVGNTLVGYPSLNAFQQANAGKLAFNDAATARIDGRAAAAQRAFDDYRRSQTSSDTEVEPQSKAALRGRLSELDNELNRYLADDYGAVGAEDETYPAWIKSHQPFHWFVEFYGIMERGGFDVIIGNPPYVEYAKVRTRYTVRAPYATFASGNLYALVLERCFALARSSGWISLIVPLSLVSTTRTESVRALISAFPTWVTCYDMRPSSLFEGVAQRLCIFVAKNSIGESELRMGGYRRWSALERPNLFGTVRYVAIPTQGGAAIIPKFTSQTEVSIAEKMRGVPLEMFVQKGAEPILVHRIVRYFIKALDFVPNFIDGKGVRGKSEDYKEFCFEAAQRSAIAAFLNSSLFYWYWRSHSDGFHCGYGDVYATPFVAVQDLERRAEFGSILARLMADLARNSEPRSIKTKAGRAHYQEFSPGLSKPITDEIDRLLAAHLAFDDDELDLIVNYDIKYRLGPDGGSGAQEED